ncbi:outer membrane beta-barrel protein [Marinobacter sp.]|uniref:outer membrane beta-barrel protein n=1 Tax=Marinobacter sp. TaxID=50741 RepID=UPI0035653F80
MKTRKLLITATTLLAFAGQAHAAGAGNGYFGLSFGQAKVKDFCDSALDSCDDTAFTGRIHGGIQLNGYTDFELGYRYMDDVDASVSAAGITVAAEAKGHFVDATMQLGVPGSGPFQVFAKAGAMYWLIDYRVSATDGFSRISDSDKEDGVALRTGIGARYHLNEDISLRADWDYLVDVGNDDIGETDIQVFSFGPEVRF